MSPPPNIAALTKLLGMMGAWSDSDMYEVRSSPRLFRSKALALGVTPDEFEPAAAFLETVCNLEELKELAEDQAADMMELFGGVIPDVIPDDWSDWESFELQAPDGWSDRESFDRTIFFLAKIREALQSLYQLQSYPPPGEEEK